jgi:hypothetical protein
MRVKLILKKDYQWETFTGLNTNRLGDFRANENFSIPESRLVFFEDFKATSQDGDTKESHYQYFEKRQYKLTLSSKYPKITWATFEEV